ncbi:hypothetical protein [Methylorubrum zatmanii]|uniref:IPTL-CTERM protein sorting domain-containing protein n=1 Tax=Methylorubrum zatmanii TaxID=29429 RepID=A0ABW1WT18_9HYPH|nr:hypothetical protein [Methylorubrum zatmanii]MBD8905521.1 hypothetical protein [Methylorubrum zatmanii]
MRHAVLAVFGWLASLNLALAQATNPAPPISETGPSGSSSPAATAAATDFNWAWISVVIALAVLVLWMVARRRQSGPPPRR